MQESQRDRFSMAPRPVRVLVRDGISTDEVEAVRHLPIVNYIRKYNRYNPPNLITKREKLFLGDNHIRRPWMEWARGKVRVAIARGEITKPDCCSVCSHDRGVISGHHDDYNKPLVVRWLCRSCHRNWHLKHDPVIPHDFESLKRSLAIRVTNV